MATRFTVSNKPMARVVAEHRVPVIVMLEIVATDDEDKRKARARYAFYRQRGYDIRVNAIEGERRQGE